MHEVICHHCGRIVHISPDAELCSVCGENLRQLLHPVYASKYFYDRAAQLASGGAVPQALHEVERGLKHHRSSELHLLGAILSKRVDDHERMRQFVAAIPVDDVLRPEGEWLLRSHQVRQRDLRLATKQQGRSHSAPAEHDPLPQALDQIYPITPYVRPQKHPQRRGGLLWLAGIALCVLLVTAGALASQDPALLELIPFADVFMGPQVEETTQTNSLDQPVYKATDNTSPGSEPAVLAPTVAPTLTPSPTPNVPENVVQATTAPEPLADNAPGQAAQLNAAQGYDLKGYLAQAGRTDLAELNLSASLQEQILTVEGIVPSFEIRQALVELTQAVPEVQEVNDAGLLLRLPPTYTVQPGDTLWDITYRLYGNVDRMQALIDANQTVLGASQILQVGAELQLPPNE